MYFFSPSTLQAALKQLTKNKVPNMAVLLKSITHTHADAKVVFKDPTGKWMHSNPLMLLKLVKAKEKEAETAQQQL